MFTLLAVTLLILHAFSLFSPFFLFPYFLSLCLPLAMFIYSLSCASSVDSFFFLKIHFYLFFFFFKKKTSFFICSSLFCKTVFVPSPLFAPFPVCFCFFNRVLSNKINWLFHLAENHLFNTSKNLFSEFLLFAPPKKKSFIVFFRFFRSSLFQKTVCFEFLRKFHTKLDLKTKWLSRSHCLEIFSCLGKKPSLQPLQKNVFFIISFLCLLSFKKKFSWKNLIRKNCFLEEKQNFFYLLLILAPSLFWAKTLFYFSVVLFFFACSFFLVSVFPNKKRLNKFRSRKFEFFFKTFSFKLFLRKEHILIQKRMCSKIIIRIFFKKNLP